jgi:phenylacetate-CoA ligase
LYPFMREKIQTVFQCKVFNRYGSREVGDIACERPGYEGLRIAPWGNYVEIVDNEGNPVPDGTEGNILVTSLTNFAMPLIRYQIGDRGVLSARKNSAQGGYGQVLERVLGRTVDTFKTKNGTLIDGEYFTHLLYFRDWVWRFQVVQESHSSIVFKIVKSELDYQQAELEEITTKAKLIMGDDCTVAFEFVDEILSGDSGKYRYTISEIQD